MMSCLPHWSQEIWVPALGVSPTTLCGPGEPWPFSEPVVPIYIPRGLDSLAQVPMYSFLQLFNCRPVKYFPSFYLSVLEFDIGLHLFCLFFLLILSARPSKA